jgi:ubiquinone/menaquinone biosynthesis C-methylase UbiE
MKKAPTDHKQAAIEQWTADPIAANLGEGEPGSAAYMESLLRARKQYGTWMADALGYAPGRSEVEGKDVLDVGCGQAIDVVGFARAGAHVTGVDLTPRHVELARAHVAALGLEATIVEGDAEHLPFPGESFDWVSSNGVLHHTPDMPAALREIRRVLRPGGTLRLTVYNRNSMHYWVDQVLARGIVEGKLFRERSMAGVLSTSVEHTSIGARPLVNVYSPKQVRAILSDAGFSRITTSVDHFHAHDAWLYNRLSHRIARLREQKTLDAVGRRAGWYVIGQGRRS